jgi:dihydroorotase
MDADATIIDPHASWTVENDFASKSRNSPFIGMKLKGRAHAAVVAGKVVHAL